MTYEEMLQKDKSEFSPICNRLLSNCFLCRKDAGTKSEYYFVLRFRDVFEHYLDILGCHLEINEEYGVIQLVNRENTNHLNLKLYESIILLILRVLYDEKKRELSLTDVVINTGDIQERFLSLKIREKQIDKTVLNNALRLFRRYHIIDTLDKDLTQEDARILIYDSVLMAVRVEDIKRVYEMIEIYRKGEKRDETSDEGQTD